MPSRLCLHDGCWRDGWYPRQQPESMRGVGAHGTTQLPGPFPQGVIRWPVALGPVSSSFSTSPTRNTATSTSQNDSRSRSLILSHCLCPPPGNSFGHSFPSAQCLPWHLEGTKPSLSSLSLHKPPFPSLPIFFSAELPHSGSVTEFHPSDTPSYSPGC